MTKLVEEARKRNELKKKDSIASVNTAISQQRVSTQETKMGLLSKNKVPPSPLDCIIEQLLLQWMQGFVNGVNKGGIIC